MAIYRGDTLLKAYKGDMQPVNIYKGATKIAGWHSQTVSGTGTISLDGAYNVPPDALVIDGKCAQTVGVWGTNLVTNGDFSNGTTGWTVAVYPTLSVSGGAASVLASGQYDRLMSQFTTIAGHKYYMAVHVKSDSPNVRLQYGGAGVIKNHSGSGNYETLRGVITASATNQYIWVVDTRASGWTAFVIDRATAIDLTTAFGAGNEPTAAQMDAYLAAYPNSWFNTTGLLTTSGTPNSPSPTYPAPISTITGDLTITGANGASSDTSTIPLGAVELCSLPDGTKDTYDAVTGVVTKRCGKVDLGSLNWVYDSLAGNGKMTANVAGKRNTSGATGASLLICENYMVKNIGWWSQQMEDKTICESTTASQLTYIYIRDTVYTSAEAFKSSVSGKSLYYKLATPTTTQLTPDLPVVRSGIKTLSVSANITPTFSATVKAMD